MAKRPQVVIVASEALGESMAGPAIRALEMARCLTAVADVCVLAPKKSDKLDMRCLSLDEPGALSALLDAEIVVGQGFNLRLSEIARLRGRLVVDGYDPHIFELLEHYRLGSEDPWQWAKTNALQRFLLARGDFFLCASDRQRVYWLGQLQIARRLSPAAYHKDPTLRSLVDVVAFGLPSNLPVKRGPGVRGQIPGIGANDFVVLWNGGIWNWLDPLTAIRAAREAATAIPSLRMVFLGVKAPNPDIPVSNMAQRAQTLAAELGLLGRHVFFVPDWVPYESRANFLLDSDVAICLHQDTPEAELSFRTRLLDCLWAGLPFVCADGDFFADLVRNTGVGISVPTDDPAAVAQALVRLSDSKTRSCCRERMVPVRQQFQWSQVMAPLVRYVESTTGGKRQRAGFNSSVSVALELCMAAARLGRWRRLTGYIAGEVRAALSGKSLRI